MSGRNGTSGATGELDALGVEFARDLKAAIAANPHLVIEISDPSVEIVATKVQRFPAEELKLVDTLHRLLRAVGAP